jgi:phage baseplate assembly protein W|tara:strand:- start:54 stop:470 length:417 start_codon:yes stop_codon:yes gene_type:complete
MADIISKGKTVASPDVYSDLNMLFTAHPITKDVTRLLDSDAIKRSVKNIVLTNYYERPFKPALGGGIRNLLFNLDTDRRLNRARKQLKSTIETFEPRVSNVFCIFSRLDTNEMQIIINYTISNAMPRQEVEFTVRRTR